MSKPLQPRSEPASRRVVRHRKLPQDRVSLGFSCSWGAVTACMGISGQAAAVGEVAWLLAQENGMADLSGAGLEPTAH